MQKNVSFYTLLSILVGSVFLFSGCGKHEARSGAVGAVAGGAIGNMVTGGQSKGFGTLVGAAIGGILGSEMGRSADEEVADEKAERRSKEIQLAHERSKPKTVVVVHEAPRPHGTWCTSCYKTVALAGARRCTDCGDVLVYEKYCDYCHESFSPRSDVRYCPYCPHRSRLVWR